MHNFNRKCFGNGYWWLRPRDNFQIKHRKDLLEKRNCNNDVYSNLVTTSKAIIKYIMLTVI